MIFAPPQIAFSLLLISVVDILIWDLKCSTFVEDLKEFKINLSKRDLAISGFFILAISTVVYDLYLPIWGIYFL